MAKKQSRLMRDSSGRMFINCKQLRDRPGFEEAPDPRDFETVGTVAGQNFDELDVEEAPQKTTKKKVAKKVAKKTEESKAPEGLEDWD